MGKSSAYNILLEAYTISIYSAQLSFLPVSQNP